LSKDKLNKQKKKMERRTVEHIFLAEGKLVAWLSHDTEPARTANSLYFSTQVMKPQKRGMRMRREQQGKRTRKRRAFARQLIRS